MPDNAQKLINIPHSFSFNGDRWVCYLGDGKTIDILGYGSTKQKAYSDLIKNKKDSLKLSGIEWRDWLHQFKK